MLPVSEMSSKDIQITHLNKDTHTHQIRAANTYKYILSFGDEYVYASLTLGTESVVPHSQLNSRIHVK